jgi:hypothetical protein
MNLLIGPRTNKIQSNTATKFERSCTIAWNLKHSLMKSMWDEPRRISPENEKQGWKSFSLKHPRTYKY